jgi:predicted dehydrogenase
MPGLQKIAGVQIAAVCNRSRASSEKFAKEYGIPEVVERWEDLVVRPDLDAALIGTWPYMHRTLSIAALDAGKHVFCQARMAMDYEDGKAMYLRARQSDRVTMLCPPPHGMPGDYQIQKLLKDGYVGKVYAASVRAFGDSFADPDAPFHWRQNRDLSGYNTLVLGMLAEVMRRWLGDTRSLSAHGRTFITDRQDPVSGQRRRVGVFDTLMISSETEAGALVQYAFSGVTRFAGHSVVEIFGSDGTIHYDLDANEITGARKGDKGLAPIPIPKEMVREWTVEQDFIDAVRTGKETHPDFYDGLKYMEFTEAAYRSAESGRRIDLPFERL